jgi:Transcriptional regulators containing a DNA-binding HTH domain and an aminotransferase domain (MocR family) and their eukaryotic orthologs
VLRRHVGRGTFVCATPEPDEIPFAWRGKVSATALRSANPALRNLMRDGVAPGVISLALGGPALELFPAAEFARLSGQILKNEPHAALGHGPVEGQPRLRRVLAGRMGTRPDRILVVAGSQQGLDLLAKCLVDPGDAVIMDRPCYLGAIQIFRAAGAKLVGWDTRRCDLGELEDLILRYRPKAIYTNPTFQNPTGHTLGLSERRELLKLLARYRVPLIEDDTYRELYLDAPPPPSLQQLDEYNLVIYLNTFSKTLAPGLRLAWIAASEVIVDQLSMLKQNTDMYSPCLTQLAVAEILHSGLFDENLRKLREEHGKRRDALVRTLEQLVPQRLMGFTRPHGGAYLWCRLSRGITTARLLPQARAMGMVFASGEVFYCDDAGAHHLRLCFTSSPVERLEEGARRLAKALEACAAAGSAEMFSVAVV